MQLLLTINQEVSVNFLKTIAQCSTVRERQFKVASSSRNHFLDDVNFLVNVFHSKKLASAFTSIYRALSKLPSCLAGKLLITRGVHYRDESKVKEPRNAK